MGNNAHNCRRVLSSLVFASTVPTDRNYDVIDDAAEEPRITFFDGEGLGFKIAIFCDGCFLGVKEGYALAVVFFSATVTHDILTHSACLLPSS